MSDKHDKRREFNTDWRAECGQLNLAHDQKQRNIYKKEQLKQTNASAQQVQSKSKIYGGSTNGTRKTTKERDYETNEFLSLEKKTKERQMVRVKVVTVMSATWPRYATFTFVHPLRRWVNRMVDKMHQFCQDYLRCSCLLPSVNNNTRFNHQS